MRVENAIRFAHDRRVWNVADSKSSRAPLLRFTLRGRRIGRLTGLGDRDGELSAFNHRIAVFKFAGVIHVNGYVGQLLQHVLSDHPGVTTAAGSNDVDALQLARLLGGYAGFCSDCRETGWRNARRDTLFERLGLLKDFLQHEMSKPLFVRRSHGWTITPFTILA